MTVDEVRVTGDNLSDPFVSTLGLSRATDLSVPPRIPET